VACAARPSALTEVSRITF